MSGKIVFRGMSEEISRGKCPGNVLESSRTTELAYSKCQSMQIGIGLIRMGATHIASTEFFYFEELCFVADIILLSDF